MANDIKYCPNCGAQVKSTSVFCMNCGCQLQPVSQPRVHIPEQYVQRNAARAAQNQTPPVRSSSKEWKKAIALLLASVIFAVTALKYPGFLIKDKRPENGAAGYLSGQGSADTDFTEFSTYSDYSDYTSAGDDPSVLTAGELPLIYSREQISEAEVLTADVAPNNETVVVGDTSVLIPSWELEPEGDRIEVRPLPELSMGEDNWTIRAYDFSLASGTHEFDSDITITIPREGGAAECSGCVWYNEETGYWEDIYSEISDDGKYYKIYTDHFSLFGEKKYRFDEKRLDLVIDDGRRIDLDHGVFIETRTSKGSRMEQKVRIDYERFWNMYQRKTLDDVKDIGRSMELLVKPPKEAATWTDDGYGPIVDTVSDVFGLIGLADGSVGTAAGLAVGGDYPLPDAVGQTLTMVDVIFTGYKVYAEAASNAITPYSKALADSVMNHKLDIFNSGVGVASTFAPEMLNPITAAVGLMLYTYSWGYERWVTDGVDEWYKQYYPDEGEVYRRFYQDAGVRLYFDTGDDQVAAQSDYHYALMDKPSSMDDKKYKEFAGFVNDRGGLRTDNYKGFAAAFSKLIELYADEPEYLETVMDELFRSAAGAFWRLPEKKTQGAAGQGPKYDFLKEYKYLGGDPYNLSRANQIQLSDAYVMRMKVDTLKILENVTTTYQRKACEAVMRKMDTELLPVLNRKLVFHVVDGSLEGEQTFADSIYCVDWKSINSNRRYRSLPDGENTFDAGFKTPMRFVGADKPAFLPLNYDGTENSVRNYYPYDPGFLPCADKKSDIVFKCTYYHYLMMGAPRKMIFTDLETGESQESDIVIPDISPTDGLRVTDVYINVNGTRQDKMEEKQYSLRPQSATHFDASLLKDVSQNATVSFGSDGSVVIDVPGLAVSIDKPASWEGYTEHYEYKRDGFRAKGIVKYHGMQDGLEVYSGYLEPGVSYSSGYVKTGYLPAWIFETETDTPFSDAYRSTMKASRADSEFMLTINPATGYAQLVLSFRGSVMKEDAAMWGTEPKYYDDESMVEYFSTTGYNEE